MSDRLSYRGGVTALVFLAACNSTSFEPSDLGLGDADGRAVVVDIQRTQTPGRLNITMDRPIWAFGRDTVYIARAYERGLYRWRPDGTLLRIAPEELSVGDTVDYWLTIHCCETPAVAIVP